MPGIHTYTDEAVIPLLREGNAGAFGVIYDRYAGKLLTFINGYTQDNALTEDMVQNIFFHLWKNRATFTLHSSLNDYLFRTAKNMLVSHTRKETVRKKYSARFVATATPYSNNNEEMVAFRELRSTIEKSISQLPARMQTAFRLSRYEHVPVKEIAKRMNISPRTVEDHISKALAHLRVSLGEFMVLVWWLMG